MMSSERVVVSVLRLAGLFLLVLALGHILTMTTTVAFEVGMTGATRTVWGIFSAALLTMCGVLIVVPGAVARRLAPRETDDEAATPWTLDDLQAALFCALGLFFLVDAVADLVRWAAAFAFSVGTGRGSAFATANVGQLAYLVVRLVSGIWLLFGARGLRGLLRTLRRAGA
jgi:hypothetical protein